MPVQLGAAPEHGFDQPLGLLSDCHRRIENFLGALHKIAVDAGQTLDERQRKAAEAALTYFRTAAPRHNADEEQSLFPLLRACESTEARAAMETVDALERDHATADPVHARIDTLYRRWIDARSITPPDRTQLMNDLESLREMYRRHIEVEDRQIFPLAGQVLSREQLHRVGQEMAGRRGVSPQKRV